MNACRLAILISFINWRKIVVSAEFFFDCACVVHCQFESNSVKCESFFADVGITSTTSARAYSALKSTRQRRKPIRLQTGSKYVNCDCNHICIWRMQEQKLVSVPFGILSILPWPSKSVNTTLATLENTLAYLQAELLIDLLTNANLIYQDLQITKYMKKIRRQAWKKKLCENDDAFDLNNGQNTF